MSTSRAQGMSIRAVANLTGIPSETLRTWERRYDLVVPGRDASGRRVYSGEQVDQLRIIAQLTDHGERVATLAGLSLTELRERLSIHQPVVLGDTLPRRLRAVVLHPSLGTALAGLATDGTTRIEVAAAGEDLATLPSEDEPDIVVVDITALGDDPVTALSGLVQRFRPAPILLTYDFMSRQLRRQLAQPGVRAVKAPLPVRELRQICADHARSTLRAGPDDAQAEEPLFTRAQLEEILNIIPDVLCECPNHLASIVLALRGFEIYSQKCVSTSPDDAALHAKLAKETGLARASMERLLAEVCAHEGIET